MHLVAAAGLFPAVDQQYLSQARQMQALSFAVHIPLVAFGISLPAMVQFVEWLGHRTGDQLAGVIVSFVAGLTTLVFVYGRRYEPARYCAAMAVAAIVAGWALARWPAILPGLTIRQAAAGHDTLVWLAVCVLAGVVILFPSLGVRFRLTLTGRLSADTRAGIAPRSEGMTTASLGALVRAAAACLIAGFGLLNIADAGWAHGVGVICLSGFVVLGFRAIILMAISEGPPEDVRSAARVRARGFP